MFKIDPIKNVVCNEDASSAVDWNKSWGEETSSVFSRTGCVISFILEDVQLYGTQHYNHK